MRYLMALIAAGAWLITSLALAAPKFPPLTGRVVDQTGLLSAATQSQLTQQLAAFQSSTSNQIVVAVINDLQDLPIEDYGYQLGRAWGIGQKDKDNGAILLVAPNARQVRIEVGYGLEGTLTDVLSHDIIQTRILPYFKQKQFEQGIVAGTQAMLQVLGGDYVAAPPAQRRQSQHLPWWIIFFLPLLFFGRRRGFLYLPSGGGRGGFGGGGFSGGGGGFGGGGASGSW
jgi:uncharacterized protein